MNTKINEEAKKQILATLLRYIEHISNEEYQRRVWIKGHGPECDDFEDFCCYFFDQCSFVLKKHKDFGITNPQYLLLKSFYKILDAFCDRFYHPIEFISSPEWKKIMEMAKEVLRAFNYQKPPQRS